jgi:hypothetical protein
MPELSVTQRAQLLQLLRLYDQNDASGLRRRLADELEVEVERGEQRQLVERLGKIEEQLGKLVPREPEPEPERRDMSAKRKSELIQTIGIEAYNALPW